MVSYIRKRNYRVRKTYRTARKVYRKNTLTKIKKQVRMLTKKVSHNTATQHLTEQIANISIVDSPYVAYNLTNWTLKGNVFATQSADWQNSNKLYHKRMTLDCQVNAGNERDLIGYRAFLVTLRDNANVPSRWNSGTGGIQLNNNLDFVQSPAGEGLINPKVFKIWKVKSFYTTSQGSTAAATGNAGDRCIKRWKWNVYPKHTVYNPSGSVSTMVTSYDPSKAFYIIILNNNYASDLESPIFTCQAYHSVVAAM